MSNLPHAFSGNQHDQQSISDVAASHGSTPHQPTLALTVKEFRAALRIGHTLAHQLIKRGEVQSFTIGRARRIVRADVERLIAERSSGSAG